MTTQSTISTSSISAPVTESSWQKKAMLSVAFLMATTSVGPGFLTQTAVFTNIYKVDMAFPVLASIFITFGIVMNLWRIVGVSGMRIQDIANKVAPGMGYGVGILLALGAVAFNFGNVSGAALGINVLTGVDTTWGALFTGVVGCLLFVVHNASKRMDQMARYLGLFMIVLIAYVAMTSLPPMGETLSAAVMPMDVGSLLLPTLTIVGGAVGGYYTGAQRLVDIGLKGKRTCLPSPQQRGLVFLLRWLFESYCFWQCLALSRQAQRWIRLTLRRMLSVKVRANSVTSSLA